MDKKSRGNRINLPPGPGPGRPRGTPNKLTIEFRETVKKVLEENSANVGVWLQQVATGEHGEKPDPGKALDLLAKLAEYAAPKLARTEVVGDADNPLQAVTKVVIEIVDPAV